MKRRPKKERIKIRKFFHFTKSSHWWKDDWYKITTEQTAEEFKISAQEVIDIVGPVKLKRVRLCRRFPRPRQLEKTGERIFIIGATVGEVKKIFDGLEGVKCIRKSAKGNVEIIHTCNKYIPWHHLLKDFRTSHYD